MQKYEFLRQPLLGELAMSRKKERGERETEKNAIYSGHLRLCQQPRAAHALRSDQNTVTLSCCQKPPLMELPISAFSYLSRKGIMKKTPGPRAPPVNSHPRRKITDR